MTKKLPAVIRKWKDVTVGDTVLTGNPPELLTVRAILPADSFLGRKMRYIDVTSKGKAKSYKRYDDDYATILVKE